MYSFSSGSNYFATYSNATFCGDEVLLEVDCIFESPGTCSDSVTSETDCPDVDGNRPLENLATIYRERPGCSGSRDCYGQAYYHPVSDMKAWTGLSGAKTQIVDLLNNVGGQFGITTRFVYDYDTGFYVSLGPPMAITQYDMDVTWTYTIDTPLGELPDFESSWFMDNHGGSSGPTERYILSDVSSQQAAAYSENSMVQLFSVEYIRKHIYWPCSNIYYYPGGDWRYVPPCNPDIDEYEREFEVFASSDFLSDPENQDPRHLSRNAELENAIKALHQAFLFDWGDERPDEIMGYFNLNIRKYR